MKIHYSHIVRFIEENPSINEVSEKLFQLGHEHEIENEIFHMEFTPNRGDCLSLQGLLRDLAAFYNIKFDVRKYEKAIDAFDFNFVNHLPNSCTHISFLKLEIENNIKEYSGPLKDYFDDLNINKNNFFTDISNYISYETGQPTHCYDESKIKEPISLDFIENDCNFTTLLDKEIKLRNKNLVFLSGDEVINLAGIMGGKDTSCSNNTRYVIVECAYFNPEDIIGKNVMYDLNSDAAHKFERGTDPLCHEDVLRRFLKIVEDHAEIKNVGLFSAEYQKFNEYRFYVSYKKVNEILGIDITEDVYHEYLARLGFGFHNEQILVPSYRSDVKGVNDIAEEIARVIGYNNIQSQTLNIPENISTKNYENKLESKIKNFLIKKGFYEVINNPFTDYKMPESINVDNPLDSNRCFLRTSLKNSLVNNLLYNERRQKFSIKLFEFSDIYSTSNKMIVKKRCLGIICSGIVDKNYRDFSKKIDKQYLQNILTELLPNLSLKINVLDRNAYQTKIKNEIVYIDIDLDELTIKDISNIKLEDVNSNIFKEYIPISDFPSSSRDLSFSVKTSSGLNKLEKFILSYKDKLLKDIFIFDFYLNKEKQEIKIGFRFVFQSNAATITDSQVNEIVGKIIDNALKIKSVSIPGL